MQQSGTVSLGPKGRTQQARVPWPENRAGGRGQRNETERTQAEGVEKPDRTEEISERINNRNDDKQAESRSYKKEGENIGKAEINRRKKNSEMGETRRGKERNRAEGKRH